MSVYYVVVIVRAIAYNKYSSSVDQTSRFLEIEMNKIISQKEEPAQTQKTDISHLLVRNFPNPSSTIYMYSCENSHVVSNNN